MDVPTTRWTLVPAAALGLLLAGCTPPGPPPDTARMPVGAIGFNQDPDVGSLNLAAYAFADPGRTYGNPAAAAKAVAALDYMAGELSTSPRWSSMSPITKEQMLQARVAVRQALGIRLDAPSQAVVDSMLAVSSALPAGNQQAALAALRSPIYTVPPEEELTRLGNMPFVSIANIATQRAAAEEFPNDNTNCVVCD